MQGETTRGAAAELQVGDVFADHRIESVVGRGGMGVVYRAVDMRLDRVAALKVIRPGLSADEDFRRRFERESQVAASIVQPNVVTIYQAGEADGLLYVTMELVDGVDLRAVITQRVRLDLQTACAIASQVAAALDAAHARGLVHRDVKPGNILVANRAPLHVYLSDFGLTKRASSQTGITRTGLFVGTLDYAAPEQIKGWPVDARADVYALGCVLFEMVAGRPPFRRENEYATMYAHMTEPAPSLAAAAPGTPLGLDAAVRRALEKEADARFPSAGDLARSVTAAVAGQAATEPERTVAVGRAAPTAAPPAGVPTPPAPAPPPPPPQSFPPAPLPHPHYGYGMEPPTPDSHPTALLPPRRGPWIPALLVALAVLVAGGAVAAVLLSQGGGKKTTVVRQSSPGQQQQQQSGAPSDAALKRGVRDMRDLLTLSAEGRTATTAGDFAGAAANRREVLSRLDALSLPPQLARSGSLLRPAMRASLTADVAHQTCSSCLSTADADAAATAAKDGFVAEFNPFALKYLGRSYDPGQI